MIKRLIAVLFLAVVAIGALTVRSSGTVHSADALPAETMAWPQVFLDDHGGPSLAIHLDPKRSDFGQFALHVFGLGILEGKAPLHPTNAGPVLLEGRVTADLVPEAGESAAVTTRTVIFQKALLNPAIHSASVFFAVNGTAYRISTQGATAKLAQSGSQTAIRILALIQRRDWTGLFKQASSTIQQTFRAPERFALALRPAQTVTFTRLAPVGKGRIVVVNGYFYFDQPIVATFRVGAGLPRQGKGAIYLVLEGGVWRYLSAQDPTV